MAEKISEGESVFNFYKSRFFIPVLLFGLVVWTFSPSLQGGFLFFDDNAYVVSNSHVKSGLNWGNFLWAFYGQAAANWHPLTWLSHQLDVQIYGLNPWGHHLTNVLLHAMNTVLVFFVFRKLTGLNWQSLVIAMLFGFHPLRVEPVAWISERKDLLSTLFWLLAIWTYAKYAENSKPKLFYGLTLLFFVLGLLSKQMVVTLPFVFLLLDFWPLQRFSHPTIQRLVLEKIPFFALTIAASAIAYAAKQNAGALQEIHLSFGYRVENAFVSYLRYLGKFFWPENLCPDYPQPGHWPAILVLPAILFFVCVSALAWTKRKQVPYLFVGWFWYVGTLVPVIELVQLHSLAMADVYAYVPMLGIYLILVLGLNEIAAAWRKELFSIAIVATIVFIAMTRHQLGFWKNDIALWSHTIAVTKNNYVAYNNLGSLLAVTQPDEGLEKIQEAIRINPDFAPAQKNLADQLYKLGRFEEAAAHYQRALQIQPNDWESDYNLGLIFFKKKQLDSSIDCFQKTIKNNPDFPDVYPSLASALLESGKIDRAVIIYQEGLKIQPDNATNYYNLANALVQENQLAAAINNYQKAIGLQPDFVRAYNNLGGAMLQAGKTDEAIGCFQKALELKPDFAEAKKNLGAAIQFKNQTAGKTNAVQSP